jgi:hypothetical protein
MCNCNLSNPAPTCNMCATTTCTGCEYTINTDCVIYNKTRLDFESESVVNNSSRTLTSVIQAVENINQGVFESEFHTIGDGNFVLDANSNDKIIFLNDIEALTGATATITLPVNSLDYVGKVFTFINRTPAANGTWSFNTPLIVDYDPLTTQTSYNSIVIAGTKVLKIAFLKTTPTSYAWFVLQN